MSPLQSLAAKASEFIKFRVINEMPGKANVHRFRSYRLMRGDRYAG